MKFDIKPTIYKKSILSDLQGSWHCLRDSVIEMPPSDFQQRLIFHIDEAMNWESVRDLNKMKKTLLLIFNIICQKKEESIGLEIIEWLEDIREILGEVLRSIEHGEIL